MGPLLRGKGSGLRSVLTGEDSRHKPRGGSGLKEDFGVRRRTSTAPRAIEVVLTTSMSSSDEPEKTSKSEDGIRWHVVPSKLFLQLRCLPPMTLRKHRSPKTDFDGTYCSGTSSEKVNTRSLSVGCLRTGKPKSKAS